MHDAAERIDCRFDALQHMQEDGEDYVKAKQGNAWGLLDWFTQTWLIEPVYAQAEEVPLVYFDSWMQSILPEIKSALEADLVFLTEATETVCLKQGIKSPESGGCFNMEDQKYKL